MIGKTNIEVVAWKQVEFLAARGTTVTVAVLGAHPNINTLTVRTHAPSEKQAQSQIDRTVKAVVEALSG